ncbi:MAG: hypothetical protein HY456_00170, partial [Parcubacteria group bacterium]|nr:hypothetical protein [Parcubacteria group bacterium]
SWTNLLADEYELYDAGAGIIKIYTHFTEGARLRFSFTAGYKIDFANAGAATHTLPFDLSDLAERLAIKLFKKRESEGKTTEAYEGGSVTWSELLDEQDKEIIARYRRLAPFV